MLITYYFIILLLYCLQYPQSNKQNSEAQFFGDAHYSGFACELVENNFNEPPTRCLRELRDFYLIGGRLLGCVLTIPEYIEDKNGSKLLKMYLLYIKMITEHKDFLCFYNRKEGLKKDKLNLFITIEGISRPILDSLLKIDFNKNILIVGLIHNFNNEFGSSSSLSMNQEDLGLTKEGRLTISKLISQNIIIDISHFSNKSFWDAIELCTEHNGKIIASHTGINSFRSHPRNLSDEQLAAIKNLNGGIGIIIHKPLISDVNEKTVYTNRILDIQSILITKYKMPYVFLGSDLCDNITPIDSVSNLSDIPSNIISSSYGKSQNGLERRLLSEDLIKFLNIIN